MTSVGIYNYNCENSSSIRRSEKGKTYSNDNKIQDLERMGTPLNNFQSQSRTCHDFQFRTHSPIGLGQAVILEIVH